MASTENPRAGAQCTEHSEKVKVKVKESDEQRCAIAGTKGGAGDGPGGTARVEATGPEKNRS